MSRHRGRPRRRGPLVVVVGVAVLATGGALAVGDATARDRRSLATVPTTLAARPSAAPEASTAPVLASGAWIPSALPEPSSTLPAVGLPADRLYIPSLRVYAPVEVAHDVGGELALPSDASHVARYDASPDFAAEAGTTIVAGHVTNTPQIGALFPLSTVTEGALVYTTDADDRMRAWKVVSISAPLKADLPADLFTATGQRRLAIITCGGRVTTHPDGTRSYSRNVVVIAMPA